MNKQNLIKKLLANLGERSEGLEKSLGMIQKTAKEAPGAMESHSDTTKYEMSRLADSVLLSLRQVQLSQTLLKDLDLPETNTTVEIATIVKVKEGQNENFYFILPPGCEGQIIEFEDLRVGAIAANSPVAKALLNKKVGDIINIEVPARLRVLEILEIS